MPLSRRERGRLAGLIFFLPGFAGVAVFYLIPLADVLRRSFLQASTGKFCGLDNYRRVLSNAAFLLAAKNTVCFVLCLPVLLLLSLFLALLFQGLSKRLKLVFKSAFLLPMAIPAASVVLLWRLLFDVHGFVNCVLRRPIDWMNSDASLAVLVFSYIWKNLGYTLVLWLAGLASVPPEVCEAAKIDGAGKITRFFKITLPLMKPMIFTVAVLSLLNSFKVFREAYLVCGSYPHERIYLLQHLFNNWFVNLDVDKMAAGSVILALVIAVLVKILAGCWEVST